MKNSELTGLFEFIKKSPTAFHTVLSVEEELVAKGAVRLYENEKWNIKKGGSYYVIRNDSSVIAFKIPKDYKAGIKIAAAHSDSPCFKVKSAPEMGRKGDYVVLNTEPYGGLIAYGWFDRPLSLAGRAIVNKNDKPVSLLFNLDKDLLVIPSLAIHMQRNVNDGIKIDMQKDMLPVLSGDENIKVMDLVAKNLGIKAEDILGLDTYLYNRQSPVITGAKEEFILSPRLDDLMCVYGCLRGYVDGKPKGKIDMLAIFDNEEVGSGTLQGADSDFLKDITQRISLALKEDKEDYMISMAESFLVSADNAHAVHPNHAENADPVNAPSINKGIVIKYSANQKYCTDAISAATFEAVLKKANVPFRYFYNKSGTPGGSTLGNISISQLSIPSVDIGLPQLAMHSPAEFAGTKDIDYLTKAMKVYFS